MKKGSKFIRIPSTIASTDIAPHLPFALLVTPRQRRSLDGVKIQKGTKKPTKTSQKKNSKKTAEGMKAEGIILGWAAAAKKGRSLTKG